MISDELRYQFLLAERLGMTQEELAQRMNSAEFTTWLAHDRSHISTSWYQTARICHTLACCFSSNPPPFESFLPQIAGPPEPPMPEALMKSNLAMVLG